MTPKNKVILAFILFFIAGGALIGYGYYAESTKTVDFGEFTIEAPQTCEFEDISSKYDTGDYNFMKAYRCTSMDLTISSFDKQYIEDAYELNTGDEIDFGKSALEKIKGVGNPQINESSENITYYITTTRVNGQIDTDVAGIYNDGTHFIIVEGGDVEFIKQITNSIKIKNS